MGLGTGIGMSARRSGRGLNLVANGAFGADLSGWIAAAGWAWSAGVAQLTGDGTAQSLVQAALLDGRVHELVFDAVITSGAGIGVFTNNGSTLVYTATATGKHRVTYRAIGANVEFKRTSGAVVGSVDNVDARLIVF